MNWDKMSRFGEYINYDPNGIPFKAKRGNPMMKSILIESHFQVGIFNSLNSPTGHWCSALTLCWVKHLSTYYTIWLFILRPQSIVLGPCTSLFLLDVLISVLWAYANIFSFNSSLPRIYNRFSNLSALSVRTTNRHDFPFSIFCLILCYLAWLFLWNLISSMKEGYTFKAYSSAFICLYNTSSIPRRSRFLNMCS